MPTERPSAAPGKASQRMSAQATRDTLPEMRLRRALHAQGLRYRLHRRPIPELRRYADLVFPTERVAIFVDGCFWHGCPEHRTHPKRNASFWRQKIDGNIRRDRETDRILGEAGWVPIRIWEHECVDIAADRVQAAVVERRRGLAGGRSSWTREAPGP